MAPCTPYLSVFCFFFILPVREVGINWGTAEIRLGVRSGWGAPIQPLSLQMSARAVMASDNGPGSPPALKFGCFSGLLQSAEPLPC